ncbi:MAG TPA: AraC family transcriptional regulator [Puia sp.]|jgi:AraC-like DNA-binding protein
MKPLYKLVSKDQAHAFHIMKVNEAVFFPSWHFHPECEIMLVEQGEGMRFVGDSIERFEAGDLILYGSNIPHLYRSDKQYYEKKSLLQSKATVIYFKEDFLGDKFLNLTDLAPIRKLFSLSRHGVRFTGRTRDTLRTKILALNESMDGLEKIIALLSILHTMANERNIDLLASDGFMESGDKEECERMNHVYQYMLDNYMNSPTLGEVAKVAHMSETAFCRYFKVRTNKTYTEFLNEMKIGNACKLLISNRLSASEICFEIGFNNYNHFNNQFKRITGLTPRQFHNKHFPIAEMYQ